MQPAGGRDHREARDARCLDGLPHHGGDPLDDAGDPRLPAHVVRGKEGHARKRKPGRTALPLAGIRQVGGADARGEAGLHQRLRHIGDDARHEHVGAALRLLGYIYEALDGLEDVVAAQLGHGVAHAHALQGVAAQVRDEPKRHEGSGAGGAQGQAPHSRPQLHARVEKGDAAGVLDELADTQGAPALLGQVHATPAFLAGIALELHVGRAGRRHDAQLVLRKDAAELVHQGHHAHAGLLLGAQDGRRGAQGPGTCRGVVVRAERHEPGSPARGQRKALGHQAVPRLFGRPRRRGDLLDLRGAGKRVEPLAVRLGHGAVPARRKPPQGPGGLREQPLPRRVGRDGLRVLARRLGLHELRFGRRRYPHARLRLARLLRCAQRQRPFSCVVR